MQEIIRNPKILRKENTALLIIDVQERIIKAMRKHEALLENILKLVKGINVLNIPIFYTEQYSKGLGKTVEVIQNELQHEAIHKLAFSCYGAGNLFEELKQKQINQIIVCGVEAHVCVEQTVLDLLANNFQVNLPVNAISSRKKIDFKSAINRLQNNGCELTTVESVLFELLEICKTPEFKSISAIIK